MGTIGNHQTVVSCYKADSESAVVGPEGARACHYHRVAIAVAPNAIVDIGIADIAIHACDLGTIGNQQTVVISTKADIESAVVGPEGARSRHQHRVVRGGRVISDPAVSIGYRPPVGDDHQDSTDGITNKKITLAINRSGNNSRSSIEDGRAGVGVRSGNIERS